MKRTALNERLEFGVFCFFFHKGSASRIITEQEEPLEVSSISTEGQEEPLEVKNEQSDRPDDRQRASEILTSLS